MKKLADFRKRSLTGILFCLVLIGAIWGGEYTFFVLSVFVVVLSHFEFFKMATKESLIPQKLTGIITGVSMVTLVFLHYTLSIPSWMFHIPIVLVILIFVLEMFRNTKQAFSNISLTLSGIIFSTLGFAFLIQLAFLSGAYDFRFPMAFFVLLWVNDSGAYLVGVSIGKRKLFERISPKKSWEGFIGGVVLSMFVGYVLSMFLNELSAVHWIVIGALIGVFGTLGDLCESMLKRSAGVKDSGAILPGHGGLMDRFDGVVFSAPIVYLYLQIIF